MCQIGVTVKVWNGDQSEYLGEGILVGFVSVYIIRGPNGIRSVHDAETKPEGVPEEFFEKLDSNPKIQLDSGRIVYGCQVWWHRIDEETQLIK